MHSKLGQSSHRPSSNSTANRGDVREGAPASAVHQLSAREEALDTVVNVETSVSQLFLELSSDGWSASDLARIQMAMDGMTSGMEILSGTMKNYHDASMSIVKNLV